MRKLWKKLHLYLGLLSGIFVFLISLSGTMYVFSDEIIEWANKEVTYIEHKSKSKLTPDEIIEKYTSENKNATPISFVQAKDKTRSFQLLVKNKNDSYLQVYIDPSTGNILKESKLYDYFYNIEQFHTELFLGAPGRTFIGLITTLFFILSISGFILWKPRKWTNKTAKNSFTVKLGANKKVVNYNLHKVLGFYILIPSVILCITGMIMVFDPLEMKVLDMARLDSNYESAVESIEQATSTDSQFKSLNELASLANLMLPHEEELRINIHEALDAQYILCEFGDHFGMKYAENYKSIYLDRSTGEALDVGFPQASANFARSISEIHTRAYMGLAYKIILFLVGIIISSLPISGFIIWHNKKRLTIVD